MTVRNILVVSGASPFRLHLVLLSLENLLLLLIRQECSVPFGALWEEFSPSPFLTSPCLMTPARWRLEVLHCSVNLGMSYLWEYKFCSSPRAMPLCWAGCGVSSISSVCLSTHSVLFTPS